MKTIVYSLLVCCLASAVIGAEAADSTILLRSARQPGQTDHVTIQVQVGGEMKYAEAGKPQQEKMSVLRELDYFEKTLDIGNETSDVWRSVRDYQKASAKVTVGEDGFQRTLPPQHHLIAAEASKQATTLFSTNGNLTRDELDAIDIQVNTLLLDRLLPEKPVAVGDEWAHSPELMAAMLGLDEVAKCTVQSTLKEVNKSRALCEMTGQVEGSINGVSTKIDIKGKYRLLLATKRVDWMGMLIQEDRKASFVEDGVDAVSRLDIRLKPVDTPESLADAAVAKLATKATPASTALCFESPGGDWQCRHDRQWHPHYDRPKNTVVKLRRVDRAGAGGHCIISTLPERDPEKLPTLEEFQEDIRRALGKNFGEFVEASQAANDANCRVYRAVAHGTDSDIAMRWIYYLVADPQGRQVALTFAVEQKLVDRFADADKPLVKSLRFNEKEKKVAPEKKAETKDHGDTEDTKKKVGIRREAQSLNMGIVTPRIIIQAEEEEKLAVLPQP